MLVAEEEKVRILFSIYVQELNDVNAKINEELAFEYMIDAGIPFLEIWNNLQLRTPFECSLLCGNHISFWDIACGKDQAAEIIEKIKQIPQNKTASTIKEFDKATIIISSPNLPDNACFPTDNNYLYYQYNEQEYGAGGSELIIAFFIGLASNFAFWLLQKLCSKIYHKRRKAIEKESDTEIDMNFDRLYRNLSKSLNLSKREIQIIDLRDDEEGVNLRIRTAKNDCFQVIATTYGKVKSIDYLGNGKTKRLTGF